MFKLKNNNLLAIFLIFIFFIFAIKGINLPFYWDTGAFLIPASFEMTQVQNVLNYTVKMTDYPHTFLLPLTLSMFYRFSAQPLIAIHLFSITVSVMFLLLMIYISKKEYPKLKFLGLFLVLSFITNPLFISQTDLVYFEIIGSLFRVAAIYFLSEKKYKYFTLFAVISFLIRFENGIILPIIGFFDYLFFERNNKKLLVSNLILVATITVWFVTHYIFTGWWFFSPERYFDENPIRALSESFSYLFIWQGRYVYTISILLGIVFSFYKKVNIKNLIIKNKFIVLLIVNAIPVFIIIAKLGYFLPRYIFPALLPFYLVSFLLWKSARGYLKVLTLSTLLVFSIFQYNNFENCFSSNYEDCTYLRKILDTKITAINYLESNYPSDLIYTYYEDNHSMTNRLLGFTNHKFKISTEPTEEAQVIYITPTSSGDLYKYAKINNYKLEKEFPIGDHNCKLLFPGTPCKRNNNTSILIYTK